MSSKYHQKRPHIPNQIRRQAEIEAGHSCSVIGCQEHTYLELHHINGNREDNRIENVILLCLKHHEMAEHGEIDRLSLKEYKRLNQQRLGLNSTYTLSVSLREKYLNQLLQWIDQELLKMECSPILDESTSTHLPPSIRIEAENMTNTESQNGAFSRVNAFLMEHGRMLLLGNGGSGKTIALLSWIQYRCYIAQKEEQEHLPVFVPLRGLTPRSDLLSLIRSALRKHGIGITSDQLETLLNLGHITLVFDGLNEIHQKAIDEGAIQEVTHFIDSYPTTSFIVSSRYITHVKELDMPLVEMGIWDATRIRHYLTSRLGTELGEKTFTAIGSNLNFEWIQGYSVAGLCSNPLTLWILAALVEKTQAVPTQREEIVDSLLEFMIARTPEVQNHHISPHVLKELFEDVAYFMIAYGYVVSISYEELIEFLSQVLENAIAKHYLLPAGLDVYQLYSLILKTGLLRQVENNTLEWPHQVLQERLSIRSSERRFSKVVELADMLRCPDCRYWPDTYVEDEDHIFGICHNTEEEFVFELHLPDIPDEYKLRDQLILIDQTGAKPVPDKILIPHALYDERWSGMFPFFSLFFIHLLGHAQDNEITQPIAYNFFKEHYDLPKAVIDVHIWALAEAGIVSIDQKNDITTIYIYHPPANPSWRVVSFVLVTLRDLSPDELEEDAEERFVITTAEKEAYYEERRRKNLPVYHQHLFNSDEENKVFRLAQKFGGRVLRKWGPYEEVLAEFPGEAWDFSQYNPELEDTEV